MQIICGQGGAWSGSFALAIIHTVNNVLDDGPVHVRVVVFDPSNNDIEFEHDGLLTAVVDGETLVFRDGKHITIDDIHIFDLCD